jgi:hypothetical protein
LSTADVLGQLPDGALAPRQGRDPPAEVLANLPVEVDESGVDLLKCSLPRLLDQLQDHGEVSLQIHLPWHHGRHDRARIRGAFLHGS